MHRLLWLTMLVGCYRPNELPNCMIVCHGDNECPSDFVCSANRCLSTDITRECDDNNVPIDASVDAAIDAPADPSTMSCRGTPSEVFSVCVPKILPDRMFPAGTTVIDTDRPEDCTIQQPVMGGRPVCVVAGMNVTIPPGATVRAVGTLPLALFAINQLTIDGTVDVSTKQGISEGAATNSGICVGSTPGSIAPGQTSGAGGGAGGTFGSGGGPGGSGAGGAGGGLSNTMLPLPPAKIRSGCAGTRGGNAGAIGGIPGNSGGAVYFMANAIELRANARINASASGGLGGNKRSGGGGGGAGGFIGFQTPSLNVISGAAVWAFGGGGGAGGGDANPGAAGSEAVTPTGAPTMPGTGGGGSGGAGEPIGVANAENGGNGSGSGGGGGGGGGAGFIGVEGGAALPSAGFQPPAQSL